MNIGHINTQGSHHSAEIRTRSAATGTVHVFYLAWRTQTVKCCNNTKTWNGHFPPARGTDSHGQPMADHWQCSNCGGMQAASYTLKEI